MVAHREGIAAVEVGMRKAAVGKMRLPVNQTYALKRLVHRIYTLHWYDL